MAALDFPMTPPPVDGQIFKADNGVWYTWKAAGSYWSGSLGTAIGNLEGYYVNKTGDKMFGDLTLGTASPTTSIILNATSGAATFDGRLTLNGSGAGTAAYIGDNGEVQITYQGNITTDGSITAAGNVGIGNFDALSGSWVSIGSDTVARVVLKCTDDVGKTWSLLSGSAGQLGAYDHTNNRYGAYLSTDGNLLLGGTLPSNPNISLNADGSITAVKRVNCGIAELDDYGLTVKNASTGKGTIFVQNSGSVPSPLIQGFDGGLAKKVEIFNNGSATFSGGVNIASALGDDKRFSISGNTGNVYVGQSSSLTTAGVLLSPNGSGIFAGNVGIGTSSLSDGKLCINGGADNSSILSGRSDGGNGNNARFKITAFADGGGANYGGGVGFQTRSTTNVFSERMRIDSSGNVGIGTPSPTRPLTVSSPAGSTNILGVFDNSAGAATNCVIAFSDPTSTGGQFSTRLGSKGDALAFYTDGANERMRITKDGNVLVGIGTPGSNYRVSIATYTPKVQIVGDDVYALALKRNNSACYLSIASDRTPQDNAAVGAITFNQRMPDINDLASIASVAALTDGVPTSTSMPGRLSFQVTRANNTSPTEVMQITSNKRVYINNQATSVAESLVVSPTQNNGDSYCIASIVSKTTGALHCRFFNGNGVVGSITTTGSNTAYNETSDYRLKENIISITDGIDRIKKLKPSRYNFIADPDTTLDGFIAHEAQAVVPESVTGEKDETEEQEYEITPAVVNNEGEQISPAVMGTRTAPVMQGIDKSKLVPLLTAALQETISKVESLEQRLKDAGL